MNYRKIKRAIALIIVTPIFSVVGFTMPAKGEVLPKYANKVVESKEEKVKEPYNYAKAFQLSMYFYDANKCGQVNGNDKLTYRGDCHLDDAKIPLVPRENQGKGTNMSKEFIDANIDTLDPDKDGCVDLSGGYHDAGDHVKFGLPQSYSASTLGWGYNEFKDAYARIGEQQHIEDILRWFNDYFLKSTFRDKDGNVVAFAYQVGDGNSDHCYWGSPELQTTDRPAYFATSETPASDQSAGAAASLAINYLNFRDKDAEYANKCLDTAKALYKFAQNNRGLGFSGGYYNSGGDEDELSWAAVWLNIATGENSYINDITSVDESGNYTGYIKKILHSKADSWQNIWVHSWDTVWGGVFAKLAPITNDPNHWYYFRWNAEYWSGVQHESSSDATYLKPTPGNFRVISTWGSARYNTAAQLCALVYNKYKPNKGFVEWAKSQMDYILGDNPLNRCYEVGYSESSAKYPHHRASHGSVTNSMENPVESKHTLWGALVGGPDFEDKHEDVRTNFVYNEVAIDYNAAFVGALAGLYDIYGEGQEPVKNFPPKEEDTTPFYTTAKVEQENKERTQVTVRVNNDTANPPHKVSNLKARYFFNISEMQKAGQTIKDLSVQVMYDQAKTQDSVATAINGPYAYDEENGVYYVDIDWDGDNFHGTRELQFALVAAQDSNYTTHWDPSNDWSRTGLSTTDLTKTDNISVYLGEKKVFGTEPAKAATINIVTPTDKQEIDYTGENKKPINITTDVKANDEKIDYVEFYADDKKIGEAKEEPYSIEYIPESVTSDIFNKDVVLTAKAITTTGKAVLSSSVNIKVIYKIPPAPVANIVIPEEGKILDVASAETETDINIEPIDENSDVEKIEVFANDEKIGEVSGNKGTVKYTAPTDSNLHGLVKVNITATATLKDGSIKPCVPAELKLKYPVSCSLNLDITKSTDDSTVNTVGTNYLITNTGSEAVDLSRAKIRYYFKSDSKASQKFFSDHASMVFRTSPWYVDATSSIKGKFVKLEKPTENADTYLEISFEGLKYSLGANGTIECQTRFANADWSMFNQEDDYSYKDNNHIVLMYDEVVVSGVEPE
ncbi:glycoside hydrolase family 9 protein [Clostridium cibarium]|uniref:Glycoside hydrolase family 9 protein n=1 Tax=Clostridium cibarium TaxID=2762247 RepID=A0ABR8PUP7_9CLOT|nr:glycoside hydrolase family 9 protein [Clostridium cibarium]MBD7911895.1 glycoside hydrolase family 9 protein [Clostridium cibarium]